MNVVTAAADLIQILLDAGVRDADVIAGSLNASGYLVEEIGETTEEEEYDFTERRTYG